ncbi:uncharacterized protein RSE6_11174 [Rhynchosporium secalis]|uniref:C2H2-type domain-containing protein n=1 Tax=Rhynchosporium secalis TaxID=38038 RepID=A0A1E1MMB2_RHYSE|nr:uncharacterized protein RSE6_11174 [Rhynchosporium secalis]
MAKRSREDFEPSSPESSSPEKSLVTARSVVHSATKQHPSSTSKFRHLSPESGEAVVAPAVEMRCSLPPHRGTLTFASFEEYDVHYAKTHTNRCLECRKNFPTEHFLNLHIEENHDAMVAVLKERGEKIYSCFVEDCDKKCSTPQKRRMHLVDKHMFPKDYDFYIVNDGIDRRSSMLRSGKHRRRSSAAQHMTEIERGRRRSSAIQVASAENGDVAEEKESSDESSVGSPASSKEDIDMDGLSGAMSSLKFVPPSVRFGRGRGRGRRGFSRS